MKRQTSHDGGAVATPTEPKVPGPAPSGPCQGIPPAKEWEVGKPFSLPLLRVLVVDDDVGIRTLLGLALPPHGLGVYMATTGEEAVELYRRHGASIDLVLTDVQMGVGMDGPQTAAALRRLNPDVRFCFMSGGAADYSTADLLALGAARVFAKPFMDLAELACALRELAAYGR